MLSLKRGKRCGKIWVTYYVGWFEYGIFSLYINSLFFVYNSRKAGNGINDDDDDDDENRRPKSGSAMFLIFI
jgi:hypothetical protein